jgi:hypothetical protein
MISINSSREKDIEADFRNLRKAPINIAKK